MARGFGISGVGASDQVATPAFAGSHLRSYHMWLLKSGEGGSGNGRIFGNNSGPSQQLYNDGSGNYNFLIDWSGGSGQWKAPFGSAGVFQDWGLSYDGNLDTNAPIYYKNGVLQSAPTLISSPVGTHTITAGIFAIGNTTSGIRNWDGIIADVAIWDAILTAREFAALATGVRPNRIRPLSLAGWWPLDGIQSPEADLSGNARNGTVTGTVKQFGPPVLPITPRRMSPALTLPVAGLDWVIRRRDKLRTEGGG